MHEFRVMISDSQLVREIFEKRVRVKSHQVMTRVTDDLSHDLIQPKLTLFQELQNEPYLIKIHSVLAEIKIMGRHDSKIQKS